MTFGIIGRIAAAAALACIGIGSAQAEDMRVELAFDNALGTEARIPPNYSPSYDAPAFQHVVHLADGAQGRIGVAAVDLSTGQEVAVLGDQRFPMASTSKIAIAAVFMEGVEQGRWSLTSEFPLLIPVRSRPFSTEVAPVTPGQIYSARRLVELMLTRSNNYATDALLKVVGGPEVVNAWARRAGIEEFNLTRDIATLVRDDGEIDPAQAIDIRDSATPRAMVQLLTGLYQGQWLSDTSRNFIISTMENCVTGSRRIPAMLPNNVTVAHKTGSLNNTSSDVGIITTPDGRAIAVAIYVTGQGTRSAREGKIASIARAIYDSYAQSNARQWVSADYNTVQN